MGETEKTRKKWWLTPLIVIIAGLIIGMFVGFLLYNNGNTDKLPVKPVAEEKTASARNIKPKIVLYPCEEPVQKKQAQNREKLKKVKPVPTLIPTPAPQQVVAAQTQKEGTECVVHGRQGTKKLIDGKMNCVWEEVAVAKPTPGPRVVAQEGTDCYSAERRGTYRVINGQMSCLLYGVVRTSVRTAEYVRSYRLEPEVVYNEPLSSQEELVYYEDDQSGSSLLPLGIAAGALWWGANRNTSPSAVSTGRAPAGVLNGRAPAGVLGTAW